VREALRTLEALLGHAAVLGEAATARLRLTVQEVSRRLERKELCVVVCGEKKAGKSTFLNALLGERILGAAARECTGTVTFIRSGARPRYRATLLSGDKEDFAAKLPDRTSEFQALAKSLSERIDHLASERTRLEQDLQGGSTELARLAQATASGRLALDGASTNVAQAQRMQEEALRKEASLVDQLRGVPFFYRSAAPWWAVWIWALRLASLPFRSPHWMEGPARGQELAEARLITQRLTADVRALGQVAGCAYAELNAALDAQSAREAAMQQLRRYTSETQSALESLQAGRKRLLKDWAAYREGRERRFLEDMRELTDMQRRGGAVAYLEVTYPARLLPRQLTVIDTPGVNTDTEQNVKRAWAAIRQHADGCILLSDLQQAVSSTTREFVQQLREVVPHILLVLTKVDRVLQNAEGDGNAQEQLDEACQVGVRRFAREVGRDPEEVLAFAIAAEAVLRGRPAGLARQFEDEIGRLFQALHHEKTMMLGALSAQAVRRCVASIDEVHERAEAAYRARIATLVAQQIPDPGAFRHSQLDRVRPAIHQNAFGILEVTAAFADREIHRLRDNWVGEVQDAPDKDAVRKRVTAMQEGLEAALHAVQDGTGKYLASMARRAARNLETQLLEELRRRYRITQQLTAAANPLAREKLIGEIELDLEVNLQDFGTDERWLKYGGAAAGAFIGTLILPGIGTGIGWAVGLLAGGLLKSLESVKKEATDKIANGLDTIAGEMRRQILDKRNDLVGAVTEALDHSLARSVQRYSEWIARVITAEQRALAGERGRLSHLLEIKATLQEQDGRLARLVEAVGECSRGLCRKGGTR
jgi:GTP-binding protein EngB required for normal cell division